MIGVMGVMSDICVSLNALAEIKQLLKICAYTFLYPLAKMRVSCHQRELDRDSRNMLYSFRRGVCWSTYVQCYQDPIRHLACALTV